MKEILFKGKCVDNGEWAQGCLLISEEEYFIVPEFGVSCVEEIRNRKTEKLITLYAFEVDSKTVCQYTGLTDKNGKKIWENDIVRRTDLHDSKEPSLGFIEYDKENTSFLIHWIDVINYSATYPWKDRIEVIGNIFDNPDLPELRGNHHSNTVKEGDAE